MVSGFVGWSETWKEKVQSQKKEYMWAMEEEKHVKMFVL